MDVYVVHKPNGRWPNGSSEPIVKAVLKKARIKSALSYIDGRPVFIEGQLFLSVSHSGALMVIALAQQPIGIDLEEHKPIKTEVIQRLALDPNDPLMDWCQREAAIKLYDEPLYLMKPIPPDTVFQELVLSEDYRCVLASKTALPPVRLVPFDEDSLNH